MSLGKRPSLMKRLLRVIGPGFITGASDDDPSGIVTYVQTGAQFGLLHLWTAVLSIPFMAAIQEMCGRIGLVRGEGLMRVLRRSSSRSMLLLSVILLCIANTVNIGADLGAMAASVELLLPIPFWLAIVAIALLTIVLEVFMPYRTYALYLKYLILSLLAYVVAFFLVEQDWGAILRAAVIPSIAPGREGLMNIVAVFGTTISPYLFFWQSDEEVEEEIANHRLRDFGAGQPRVTDGDLRSMRLDTIVGMVVSNVIAFCIIALSAATLFPAGITRIETAAQAAEALRPIAGDFTSLLFAAGIIGTGLLAVPILAGSASYALAEIFGLREGLSKKPLEALGFYVFMILATLGGLFINVIGIPPFRMLYLAAILNGLIAPVMIYAILLAASDRRILGRHVNGRLSTLLGLSLFLFMLVIATVLVIV